MVKSKGGLGKEFSKPPVKHKRERQSSPIARASSLFGVVCVIFFKQSNNSTTTEEVLRDTDRVCRLGVGKNSEKISRENRVR